MMARGLSPNTIEILDVAMSFVKSVDYRVSLRWLFYRMLQAMGLRKSDYGSLKRHIANARKKRLRGWHPSTLADETRTIYNPNKGFPSVTDWVHSVKKGIPCKLDKHIGQRYNVHVWFEAKAMSEQFKKYSGPYYVPLAPFGGDASIPFKKEIADGITRIARNGMPVKVLYFGDLDPKGLQIPLSALTDIREWTPVNFEFIRVGLNEEHIEMYDLPENPLKVGEYQWEALEDEAASHLITNALDRFIDLSIVEDVKSREARAEEHLSSYLKGWDPESLIGAGRG